jgi:hypothetical protein
MVTHLVKQYPNYTHKSPPLDTTLKHVNPVHTATSYFFRIHFNIILSCTLGSSAMSRFSEQNCIYLGLLISLWPFLFPIFLFTAQPKEFFLDVLKKLEQRSDKCVELKGEYVD